MAVELSIIIPAHNEADCIEATVRQAVSAAEATGRPFEVIVSCDGCTDDTAALALRAGARTIDVNHRQIAATRNSGGSAATGDYLFFLDADTFLPELTLAAAIEALDDGAVGGGATVVFDDQLQPLMSGMVVGIRTLMRWLKWSPGCFIFCTRNAFEASGGYDERFYASEEAWFSMALKKQGPFVILPHFIETSSRKNAHFSSAYLIWRLLALSIRGPRAMQKREGLEIWYDWRPRDNSSS